MAITEEIRLLDVVALTGDVLAHGLLRGQVGTVVETLAGGYWEVEFSDDSGRAYAQVPLASRQMIVLRYQPAHAA